MNTTTLITGVKITYYNLFGYAKMKVDSEKMNADYNKPFKS